MRADAEAGEKKRGPLRHEAVYKMFKDPPTEFGLIPFWFWNDDLNEEELVRQVRSFHEAGFGGIMPHARVGLSHRVGYLTDEFFRLVRVVVEEAARLGMKVILYDEGSYPSGSANGAVVAENPDYATRSIRMWDRMFEGPHQGFWRPNTGRAMKDRHVCTVLGLVLDDGSIDASTVRVLEPEGHTIFRIDIPEGRWKAMSVWDVASGGVIRGVFEESEDGHATAPPSGDILNPEAVACFLRLTHDRYFETLEPFFGDTIIAMFTDEPNVLGRGGSRRGQGKPYTPGFEDWIADRWGEDPRPWLPALWEDYGEETEAFRHRYSEAVYARLVETFYNAQSEWCAEHGIALTGHPAESNELSPLRLFQMPGQDMVWRYVEPDKLTAIDGIHSTAAKTATSGARLSNRRRILTEVCGAYGWQLSLDEVKWLFDWHLVRGNNLINPHAVFYSIRERRAWESEPDLAFHNIWWPYFKHIALYSRRLCWILSDGEHLCDVAILGDGNAVPWESAKELYQNQIDFLYLDDQAVSEAVIEDNRLAVGSQRYQVVIIEGLQELSQRASDKLDAFRKVGGTVVEFDGDIVDAVDRAIPRDLEIALPNPDLRHIHFKKDGLDLYLLVNEGDTEIDGLVTLSVSGSIEIWDAMSGDRRDVAPDDLNIQLGRRESLILAVDSSSAPSETAQQSEWSMERIELAADWISRFDGEDISTISVGDDWARVNGWELFSGCVSYSTEIAFPDADSFELDMGKVGEIAEVLVDGESVGCRMWAPHIVHLGSLSAGQHLIEVRVTNSMANEYEGMQLPSGLIGPVALIARRLE